MIIDLSDKDLKKLKGLFDTQYITLMQGLKNRPNMLIKYKLNSLLNDLKELSTKFELDLIEDKYINKD